VNYNDYYMGYIKTNLVIINRHQIIITTILAILIASNITKKELLKMVDTI
jgi:hypothetical protein